MRKGMLPLVMNLVRNFPMLLMLTTSFLFAQKPHHVDQDRNNTSLTHINTTVTSNATFNVSAHNAEAGRAALNSSQVVSDRPGRQDKKLKCSTQQRNCHTYLYSMYGFYTMFGGYFMSTVVVLGIAFLVITHFHGRYIVKTKPYLVSTVQKWDLIQHRKQKERNINWI